MRGIDKLGRIVIPMELRRKHGIVEGGRVEFIDTEDGITVRAAKSPFTMCDSSSLSHVHIRISLLSLLITFFTDIPTSIELSGILNLISSTRSFAKVSILLAAGNLKTRAISSAAAYSGFITIASPSSFFK